LTGKDRFLIHITKQITEAAIKAELEQHLEEDNQPQALLLKSMELN